MTSKAITLNGQAINTYFYPKRVGAICLHFIDNYILICYK